ncbi:assimilatory nitrite reductase large subunit [Betaproteobacteria bacterium GR16-43]|nr:assimilatory nitrite reductase large subunit [Betaproteobacteria bacterium GR16-43]
MKQKPRLVVIGHGMAAARTLEHLMAIAPGRHDITVIGAEPLPGYNRILLSPVLAGELGKEELKLQDSDWYAQHGIRLRLGRKAVAIARGPRSVKLDDGEHVPYDKLLLATGSRPIRLPIEGANLEGVVTYRDLADTEAMIAASARHKHAVVIGGGLLGLEAANGLKSRGMEVDVVHLMPWVMERQLDREAASVVQRRLEARGIRFHLGYETLSVEGVDGHATAVAVRPRDTQEPVRLAADLVVMAVGIRPDTALAEAAGLRADRGIVVDDTLQTYDPRIYAVGECVRHRGTSYGLVQPLYDMAKVCATHLAGVGSHYYAGSVTSTHLKVTGIDVFSAGDFADSPRRQSQVLHDAANGVYRRLVIEDDRLVGGVLVGDSAGSGRYSELIRSKASIARMRRELMFLR